MAKPNINDLFLDKKPKSMRKHVGVEIEFCAPITSRVLGNKLYKAGVLKYCTWKLDRSLRPDVGEIGHELCILATEGRILGILKKVCGVLEKAGAVAEKRRCGLHVHLDMRNRDKEKVYNNLLSCQKLLLDMTAPNRRDTEFCKKVTSRQFPRGFYGNRTERYKTINAASYYIRKTIEVRLHEGTVDVNQIVNWTRMLIKIANHKGNVKNSIPRVNKLVDTFGLSKSDDTYIRDRINHWKKYIPEENNDDNNLFGIFVDNNWIIR